MIDCRTSVPAVCRRLIEPSEDRIFLPTRPEVSSRCAMGPQHSCRNLLRRSRRPLRSTQAIPRASERLSELMPQSRVARPGLLVISRQLLKSSRPDGRIQQQPFTVSDRFRRRPWLAVRGVVGPLRGIPRRTPRSGKVQRANYAAASLPPHSSQFVGRRIVDGIRSSDPGR